MTAETPPHEAPEAIARRLAPVLRESAAKDDEAAAFPVEALAALRETPLMGLLVPVEHGGLGADAATLARTARELAAGSLSAALIWAMHCQQVAALAAAAPPALAERLLPRIARGEVYLASVTTESGKGGHLTTAVAPLTRQDGRLRIHREAPIVTGGEHADGFLITLRDGEDAADTAVSLVYADREQLTVRTSGDWNPMGMRATHSVALTLDGEVPADQLVGTPGRFADLVADVFGPFAHVAWAACWLGAATGVTRDVLGMLRDPKRRTGFDLSSELVLDRIARIRMDLDAVAAYVRAVADEVDAARGGSALRATDAQLRINGLKVFASETLMGTADRLMDLTGLRHGYQRSSPLAVERLFRDLKSARLNYSNDRLTTADGLLAQLDPEVSLDPPDRRR
ncbi:MAG: acyl-CoA/acyl-ACP dehydrogenase [Catenulispora sp.]|nr:acyl-CoA/acyl-ACP dehydrogenase [Catenulispora sp.]